MRVIGVDPGTIRTGWGVVERDRNRIRGIDAGVIDVAK
ncbi:MAG: crossover junction endodeoxyribonuclease RuvC, partial [Deltaproteobacteria bacterium]|nr:crossover junction endodeoxyribonuclease RuvC [Deltaproteobacteria bacterium]